MNLFAILALGFVAAEAQGVALEEVAQDLSDSAREAEEQLLGTVDTVYEFPPVAVTNVREPNHLGLYAICAGAGLLLLGMMRKKQVR